MRKDFALVIPLILVISIFSISMVAAAGSECNLWCRIVYLFTGKIIQIGDPTIGIDVDKDGYSPPDGANHPEGYGYGSLIADCDDNNDLVNPNMTEVCNGIDDNCEDGIDEGNVCCGNGVINTGEECDDANAIVPQTCGIGACQRGVDDTCINSGLPNQCKTVTCISGPPSSEICNNIDDDCDGMTDEGLGQTTCGTGVCELTILNCVNGQTQTCTPVCNDNDLDNWPDQCVGYTASRGTGAETEYYSAGYGFGQYYNLTEPVGSETFWTALKQYSMDVYNFFGALIGFRTEGYGETGPYGYGIGYGYSYEYCKPDCNDTNNLTHPLATEVCNGIDDNCNNLTDEGCVALVPVRNVGGACAATWQCTEFGECVNEIQTRTCIDIYNCNTTTDKPTESQSCEMPLPAPTITITLAPSIIQQLLSNPVFYISLGAFILAITRLFFLIKKKKKGLKGKMHIGKASGTTRRRKAKK